MRKSKAKKIALGLGNVISQLHALASELGSPSDSAAACTRPDFLAQSTSPAKRADSILPPAVRAHFLSAGELARASGQTPRTIARWRASKLLPEPVRAGREVLFCRHELVQFFANNPRQLRKASRKEIKKENNRYGQNL